MPRSLAFFLSLFCRSTHPHLRYVAGEFTLRCILVPTKTTASRVRTPGLPQHASKWCHPMLFCDENFFPLETRIKGVFVSCPFLVIIVFSTLGVLATTNADLEEANPPASSPQQETDVISKRYQLLDGRLQQCGNRRREGEISTAQCASLMLLFAESY